MRDQKTAEAKPEPRLGEIALRQTGRYRDQQTKMCESGKVERWAADRRRRMGAEAVRCEPSEANRR
jgi:hypothetical protein